MVHTEFGIKMVEAVYETLWLLWLDRLIRSIERITHVPFLFDDDRDDAILAELSNEILNELSSDEQTESNNNNVVLNSPLVDDEFVEAIDMYDEQLEAIDMNNEQTESNNNNVALNTPLDEREHAYHCETVTYHD